MSALDLPFRLLRLRDLGGAVLVADDSRSLLVALRSEPGSGLEPGAPLPDRGRRSLLLPWLSTGSATHAAGIVAP